jgi:uncharacterized membrane protein
VSVSGTRKGEISRRIDMAEAGINLDAVMEQHKLAVQSHQGSDSQVTKWLPILIGGLLTGFGLSQRSLRGMLIAVAGGGVMYYGMTRRMPSLSSAVPDGQNSIRVEKVVTISKPIEEVYGAWCDVTKLPRILSHLESVTDLGDGKSHWVAKAPLGLSVEWDAETMVDHENRVIAWRSVGEADVPNVGAMHFHEVPGTRGTEARVRIEYSPPLGPIGAIFAKVFGEEPSQQVEDDLRRFKQVLETGESPTTEGQPRGGS